MLRALTAFALAFGMIASAPAPAAQSAKISHATRARIVAFSHVTESQIRRLIAVIGLPREAICDPNSSTPTQVNCVAVNSSGALSVTTTAGSTAAPGYTRLQDGTSTNLLTIDSLGRLTTTPVGCGADVAFPTSISTSGTSLGTPPACAKGVEMDVPPGATVAYYVAQSGLGSSAAAVAVSHQYANASSSLQPLPVQVNLSNSQLVFVTYVVAGTSGTYISGLPTFRWI